MMRYHLLCSWNSPAPKAGNTGFLSLQICVRQTVRLTTEFVDWCRNMWTLYKIPVCDTSDLKQRLIDTWASIIVIDEAVAQRRKRLRASMKAKGHHFEHLLNWNRLFSEPTHYTTISKSEGRKKVEHASFLKVCWCCLPKIINISPCLLKL